jgi:DNA-binding CsgD family transcriptional regulator
MGNRYPKYHFEKLIKLIDRNISSENDWNIFETHFDQAHENFFRRLKEAYPDLTPSDLKLCAYLRLNLTSKEIAPLLNISLRGVEVRRYRLRKRLRMKTEENLINFLLTY